MRRLVPVVALAIAVGATTLPAPADPDFDAASAALQNGDYATATPLFERMTANDPTWAAGFVSLGQCYYMTDRPDDGDAAVREARRIDPGIDVFQVYARLGRLLYSQQRFREAVPPLARALDHSAGEDRMSISRILAYAYLEDGQYPNARQAYERHQREYGIDPASSWYLANACRRMGDHPCSVDSLRRATGEATDDAGDTIDTMTGKVREYLAKWSREWALLPENDPRRDELIAQAAQDARPWFEGEPGNPTARRYFVETSLAAGRFADIVDAMRPLAERDPRDCAARTTLAAAYNGLGRTDDAETWAEAAVRCDAADAAAHVELAVAHIGRLRPECSSLDEALVDRDRARDVVASLQRAIELDPGRSRAVELLADVQDTLALLDRLVIEFLAQDRMWRAARDREIIENCKAILWKRRTESQPLTAVESAFVGKYDCLKLVGLEPR